MNKGGAPRRSLLGLGGTLAAGLGTAIALAACGGPDPSTAPTGRGRTDAPPTDPTGTGPSDGGGTADAGQLLFDARFAEAGLAAYSSYAPQEAVEGEDLGLEEDPLGERGRVAWFDSRRGLHVGTPYPRAQILTPPLIQPGQEYWMLLDVLVPEESAPREPDDWITLATGAFGAPFGDSSPLGLAVVRSRTEGLYLQLGADYTHLEESVPFPTDRWVRLLEGFRFAADGWVEVSMGRDRQDPTLLRPTGAPAASGPGRIGLATQAQGINDDEDNASRIGVYGTSSARVWCATHRIATSRTAVLAGA